MPVRRPLAHHTRRPGALERWYICRNVGQFYRNFNVTGRFNHHVSPEMLSHALRGLILRYLCFASSVYRDADSDAAEDVARNGHNFAIRPLPCITFDDAVEHRPWNGLFDSAFFLELDNVCLPLNVDKPTWKVLVFELEKTQYFLFLNNHVFFDGYSGAHFFEDLAQELAFLDPKVAFLPVLFDYNADKAVLPPLNPNSERLADMYRLLLAFFLNMAFWELCPKPLAIFLISFFNPWMPNLYENPYYQYGNISAHRRPSFRAILFLPEEVTSVLSFCRRNDTTMTAFFTAVSLSVLQSEMFPYSSAKKHTTSTVVVLQGRRYYPELAEKMRYGLFVSGHEVFYRPISLGFADIVSATHDISREIKAAVQSRVSFRLIAMIRYINVWKVLRSTLKKALGLKNCEVSNLGNRDFSVGDWSVDDLWFSQSATKAVHYGFSIISTKKLGMNVTLGYPPEFDDFGDEEDPVGDYIKTLKATMIDMAARKH